MCLGILEVYGVGPRALRILRRYWENLKMVVQAVGYYGATFRGERGFTQGKPLSPTIFKVVVDALVCPWESLAEREGGCSIGDNKETALTTGRKIWD